MRKLTQTWAGVATSLVLAFTALIATPAQAQNSREAIEAARQHRAETGQSQRAPAETAPRLLPGKMWQT